MKIHIVEEGRSLCGSYKSTYSASVPSDATCKNCLKINALRYPEHMAVLVSGGRSSARMARHIQQSEKYLGLKKSYIFCNTGQERPETIQFLKDLVNFWGIDLVLLEGVYSSEPGVGVSHKVVTFETMDMSGRVFSECIAHLNKNKWTGVPNQAVPYCSEYLKTRVSHSYCREVFGTTNYVKAIGYRAEDMPKRITLLELEADSRLVSPLLTDFEEPQGLKDLDIFFDAEPFYLTIDGALGNCELCHKKSDLNLVQSIQYGTRFVDWYMTEELFWGNTFFRGRRSIQDLVELASQPNAVITNTGGDSCVCNFK